jgi:hypothetical protein
MVYYRLIMVKKPLSKRFPPAFSREKASRAKSREAP